MCFIQVDKKDEIDKDEATEKTVPSLVSQVLNAADTLPSAATVDSSQTTQRSPDTEEPAAPSMAATDSGIATSVEVCEGNGTKLSHSDDQCLDTPATLSRRKLGFSSNSAFAPVRKSLSITSAKANEMTSNSVANDVSGHESDSEEFDSDTDGSEQLESQVEELRCLFEGITRLAQLVEKALRSSLNDSTFEK